MTFDLIPTLKLIYALQGGCTVEVLADPSCSSPFAFAFGRPTYSSQSLAICVMVNAGEASRLHTVVGPISQYA